VTAAGPTHKGKSSPSSESQAVQKRHNQGSPTLESVTAAAGNVTKLMYYQRDDSLNQEILAIFLIVPNHFAV
jgi:hypothetical protein